MAEELQFGKFKLWQTIDKLGENQAEEHYRGKKRELGEAIINKMSFGAAVANLSDLTDHRLATAALEETGSSNVVTSYWPSHDHFSMPGPVTRAMRKSPFLLLEYARYGKW